MTKEDRAEFRALLAADEMTPASVARAVQLIGHAADDDEVAHGMEDALHRAVLQEIAKGVRSGGSCQALAEAALATGDLPFSRWCA